MTNAPIASARDHLELFADPGSTRHVALIGPDTAAKRNILRHYGDAALADGAELLIVDVDGRGSLVDDDTFDGAVHFTRTIGDAAQFLNATSEIMEDRKALLAKHSVSRVADLPEVVRPEPLMVIVTDMSRVISSGTRTGQATALASESLLKLLREARFTAISVVFAATTERFSDAKAPGAFLREVSETYLFGEWTGPQVSALSFTSPLRRMAPDDNSCLWADSTTGQLHNITVAPRLDTPSGLRETVLTIPLEQSLLIAGPAGSGKTCFMEQRARDAVAAGHQVLFIGNPNHPHRKDTLPDEVNVVYDEFAVLDALTAVVNDLEFRARLLKAEGVWRYADVQSDTKPAPILIAVEEFCSLVTPDRTLEFDYLPSEFMALRQAKQEIGHKLGSLLRASRNLGVTVLLATQRLSLKGGDSIPGFSSISGGLGRLMLGQNSLGSKMALFRDIENLPETNGDVIRGRGLYEPPVGSATYVDLNSTQ